MDFSQGQYNTPITSPSYEDPLFRIIQGPSFTAPDLETSEDIHLYLNPWALIHDDLKQDSAKMQYIYQNPWAFASSDLMQQLGLQAEPYQDHFRPSIDDVIE